MNTLVQFLAKGVTAFYLGHSLMGEALPEMMQDLLEAPVQYQLIIGAPLEVQWNEPNPAQGVKGRDWLPGHAVDALVLTERVALGPTIEVHDTPDYAARWVALARQGNPAVRPYLYQTWDDIDDAATGTTRTWRDRIEADLPLWQGVVDDLNADLPTGAVPARLIPAGLGMVRLHDAIAAGQVPGARSIRDFFRDNIHPTDTGFYYVAMIHYATLTGHDPRGLPGQLDGRYGPYPPVPPEQVPVLQDLAWQTVRDFDAGR